MPLSRHVGRTPKRIQSRENLDESSQKHVLSRHIYRDTHMPAALAGSEVTDIRATSKSTSFGQVPGLRSP